jgi:protein O-GlcNAc transferase
VPVLTIRGNAFAGRVAASVLSAAGLPELVTASIGDYQNLALELAREPHTLAAIKAKLARNRETSALFDTARYTRDLEAAYTQMWQRQRRSETPTYFAVPSSS